MFKQALLPDTFRAIQLVAKFPEIKSAYLAGGTALALQIGHRISVDLDFFTAKAFEEKILAQNLGKYPEFKQESLAWRTIMGKIDKTKFSLFYYKYPLIKPMSPFFGLQLASLADIAAMKINAIEDRGTKRDFVDLFFLAKNFSLEEMLDFYDKKYATLADHLYGIIRALDYFEDADHDTQEPKMLVPINWEEIKNFFRVEAKRLAKLKLGV